MTKISPLLGSKVPCCNPLPHTSLGTSERPRAFVKNGWSSIDLVQWTKEAQSQKYFTLAILKEITHTLILVPSVYSFVRHLRPTTTTRITPNTLKSKKNYIRKMLVNKGNQHSYLSSPHSQWECIPMQPWTPRPIKRKPLKNFIYLIIETQTLKREDKKKRLCRISVSTLRI